MMKSFGSSLSNLIGHVNPFSNKMEQEKIIHHAPKQFSSQIKEDGTMALKIHATYTLKKQDKYYQDIQTMVLLANQKNKTNAGKIKDKFHLEYYPSFEFQLANSKMEEEMCPICLCEFQIKAGPQLEKQLFQQNDDDIYMLKCSHKFHLACLKNLIGQKHWAKCPVCSTIFGVMTGDQPEGTMNVTHNAHTNIPGHGKGAIVINYHMQGGVRNGKAFAGTSRIAYLPDNKQGREVLALLQLAFKRKLIFTVGRSVTTGLDNQTVWNGIHHKTSTHGGVASFGYPDQTYLTRVKEELAAKGVTTDELDE